MASEERTTVILCRHGESEGNREGRFGGHGPTPLTERGRDQARAAGKLLARTGVDVIYTSDLVRAEETAELIGGAIGVAPQSTPALRERSVGCLTGLTFEEARAGYADAFAALLRGDPTACPPGGETYAQCRQRAAAFLAEAIARNLGGRLLLVSHRLTLLHLIRHILGIRRDGPDPALQFQVDHCALHRFERTACEQWNVVALNERNHLPAD